MRVSDLTSIFSVMLICIVYFLFPSHGSAKGYSSSELYVVLEEMGAQEIQIEGCKLRYSFRSNNIEKNYTRWVFLKKLDFSTSSPIRFNVYNGKKSYYYNIQRKAEYFEDLIPFIKFKSWLMERYKYTTWPFSKDDKSKEIEKQLYQRVGGIDELSRYIFDGSEQKRTDIQTTFTMGFDDLELLKRFKSALSSYYERNDCEHFFKS